MHQILTDTVKHHDGVVYREADDGKQCRQEVGIDLKPNEVPENGGHTKHHQHVVEHGKHGTYPITEGVWCFAEGHSQVNQNRDTGAKYGNCRAPGGFGTHGRSDTLERFTLHITIDCGQGGEYGALLLLGRGGAEFFGTYHCRRNFFAIDFDGTYLDLCPFKPVCRKDLADFFGVEVAGLLGGEVQIPQGTTGEVNSCA